MFETCERCGQPIIPRHCPHCGALIDGHTAVDLSDACPVPEKAVCICIYCSGISIFTKASMRIPTDEEWREAMNDPYMQKAIAAVALMREEGKIPPCR